MNVRLMAIVIALVLGLVGIGILNGGEKTADGEPVTATVKAVGESPLGLTLTEAGDFECPACSSFHPILKSVKPDYVDKVVFEFKHFPLTTIHPNARAAHRASEAARKQGKFWEMHDLLFEQRNLWVSQATTDPVPQLETFATELGLDLEQFKVDFASVEANEVINLDLDEMREKGATSTPTFYFNGELVSNSEVASEQLLRDFLDRKIAEANGETTEETTEANPTTDEEIATPVEETTTENN